MRSAVNGAESTIPYRGSLVADPALQSMSNGSPFGNLTSVASPFDVSKQVSSSQRSVLLSRFMICSGR